MTQQIQGILKPMPEYGVHYRAGVMFDKRGREFIVDDAAVSKAKSEAQVHVTALEEKLTKAVKELRLDDEREARAQLDAAKMKLQSLSSGVLEESGKPLKFSTKMYEYMQKAFGTSMVCDAWDGGPRAPEPKILTTEERFERLEAGFNELLMAMKALKK